MITLKFPKLEKALIKNTKDLPDDNIQKGIFVFDNKAFVINDGLILCYDLYDYFTLECGVEDDEEIKELKSILMFLDGKVISSEFWSELTKGADMEIDHDKINISNPKYSKELYHKDSNINPYVLIKLFSNYKKFQAYSTEEISIPLKYFKLIQDTATAELKNDSIIFNFKSADGFMMFTFQKRKYVYGLIEPNYDAVIEAFKFDALHDTATALFEVLDFYAPKLPEPPKSE